MKLLLCLTLLFSSCASYVNSLHKQIDRDERSQYSKARRATPAQNRDRGAINNPVTLGGRPSANSVPNMEPATRRQYNSPGKRRYQAQDLQDNGGDGSLWSGTQSSNYLFVTNNLKKRGDIVIVEVMKALKDKIETELKRNFPDRPKKKSSKNDSAKDDEEKKKKEAEAKAEAAASDGDADPEKIYDKIATKVIEVVNQDYLLLRGRKEVIFKKAKRYFEFQAVVPQKDIAPNDTIKSKMILEPQINVMRY